MSNSNQLSRYGALTRLVPSLAPSAKVFIVGDSDDTSYGIQNLAAEFPPDGDGVTRVYSTIQAAVNAASAGRGDVVLVAPGYDHSLGRADSWATAGVSVIGLGSGMGRPIIRYTGIADEIGIAANNVTVENLRLIADVDSVERGIDLDSGFSGGTVRRCVFDFNANADNFVHMIRNAQARSVIENNEFLGEDTAGGGSAISLRGGYPDYAKIKNNFFYGQFDTVGDTTNGSAAISVDVTHDSGDTVLNGLEVSGNKFVSMDTAAAVIVNFGGGATTVDGIASDNRFVSYDTATADTAQVNWGGVLPVINWFKTGDSDVAESIVGHQAKLAGIQDS